MPVPLVMRWRRTYQDARHVRRCSTTSTRDTDARLLAGVARVGAERGRRAWSRVGGRVARGEYRRFAVAIVFAVVCAARIPRWSRVLGVRILAGVSTCTDIRDGSGGCGGPTAMGEPMQMVPNRLFCHRWCDDRGRDISLWPLFYLTHKLEANLHCPSGR